MAQIYFSFPKRKEKIKIQSWCLQGKRQRLSGYLNHSLVEGVSARDFCGHTNNISLTKTMEAHPGKTAILVWPVLTKFPGI